LSPCVSRFTYYTSSLEIVYNTTCIIRIIYGRRACRSICRRPAHFVVKLGQLIISVVSSIRGSDYPSLSFTSVFIPPPRRLSVAHALTTSLSPRQPFSHCLYIAYIMHIFSFCVHCCHTHALHTHRAHAYYTYTYYIYICNGVSV